MNNIPVVCPSKGRPNNVKTLQFFPDLILVVPHSEVEAYKANYPDTEVIGTPKHIRGITPTRQWIIEQWDDVFMIDDDVEAVWRNFTMPNEPYIIDDVVTIREILQTTAGIAKDIGAKVYSFGKIKNPLEYNSFKPLDHVGYMNASFCGFIAGHGLSYDLSMSEGEDHYISCLNIYKHRYSLIDNRYMFRTLGNFNAIGGCNDYRTRESMIKNTLYLRKKFGEVIKFKEATAIKKNVNFGERSLIFPY